jgi:membrane protein
VATTREHHLRRERVVRTLTFWLRPRFVLRVVSRFQKVAGFDRGIALASSALTALIPLSLVVSGLSSRLGGKDTADRVIDRYDLTGGGAEAVKAIFSPPEGTSTSVGLLGLLFLMVAVLSFTRTVQRVFEQVWELKPLSVRNSLNGLKWIAGLTLYTGVSGLLHVGLGPSDLEVTATVITLPLTAVFLGWSAQVLSAGRIPRRQLVPFAILGAVLLAIYSVGARVYVPHLFSTYATRYGVIGAVFAMISALFCIMVVIVGSAAAGREIADELDRIKRGERPADDEVRRQWNEITAEARLRWETIRTRRLLRKDGEEEEGGEQDEVDAALLQGGPAGQHGERGHDDRDRE